MLTSFRFDPFLDFRSEADDRACSVWEDQTSSRMVEEGRHAATADSQRWADIVEARACRPHRMGEPRCSSI